MTRLVIFDLDGTLVDTPRAIVDTFTSVLTTMGRAPPPASAIRATIGLPLGRAFATLLELPEADERVACAVKDYQATFKERVLPRAPELLFPSVADGLAMLRRDGFALAVATSKVYASADALLRAAGLRDHFHVVVGADQVTRPKPDPESGALIARTLAVAADRAVMVGDTTHDVLMAHAAGMRSVAVTYGVHSAGALASCAPTWMADDFRTVLQRVSDQ